jgi:hypothetical protein
MFDIYTIIGLLIWAVIDYFAADFVARKNDFMKLNPILYAIGAMAFGGIFPLIFLVIKYIYCSYRAKH